MKRAFTTREKVMLLVLTVLLIVIAYFKLILEPINNSIDEYQSETAAEQDEILQNTAFFRLPSIIRWISVRSRH